MLLDFLFNAGNSHIVARCYSLKSVGARSALKILCREFLHLVVENLHLLFEHRDALVAGQSYHFRLELRQSTPDRIDSLRHSALQCRPVLFKRNNLLLFFEIREKLWRTVITASLFLTDGEGNEGNNRPC